MKAEPISELFDSRGAIIYPSLDSQDLTELEAEKIISLFERHGVLIFRGFDIQPDALIRVIDHFSESYAPDALRREPRFGQKEIHNVDSGNFEIPLHSEASFSPSWPEIVWFYCVLPPIEGGCTTLCDGVNLWRSLSEKTKTTFLSQPLRYEIEIEMGQKVAGRPTEPLPSRNPGVSGYIRWPQGIISLNILRYAVNHSRLNEKLCFANHLLAAGERQIRLVKMGDGSAVPVEALREIELISQKLTFDLKWQSRDLLMIDNIRFMHGRRAYPSAVKRDIVQVQTHRASFAFGATTRQGRYR